MKISKTFIDYSYYVPEFPQASIFIICCSKVGFKTVWMICLPLKPWSIKFIME